MYIYTYNKRTINVYIQPNCMLTAPFLMTFSASDDFMNDVGKILRKELTEADIDISFDEEYEYLSTDTQVTDLLEGIRDEARSES